MMRYSALYSFAVVLLLLISFGPFAQAAQEPWIFSSNANGTVQATYTGPIGNGNGGQGYQASSSGSGASGLGMSASIPVQVGSPNGAAITAGLTVAAAALIASGAVNNTVDHYAPSIVNPGAALSTAGLMLVSGASLCGPAMPACLTAGIAAMAAPGACAAVGCTFFDSMSKQGIKRNPDGSFSRLSANTGSQNCGPSGYAYCVAAADGRPAANYVCPSGGLAYFDPTGVSPSWNIGWGGSMSCGFPSVPSPSAVPATNADIVAAIDAATAASNRNAATAEQNAAAADAINLALLDGMSLAALQETVQLTRIASAFTQQNSATDALNNNIKELSRNIITLSPGPNAASPPIAQPSVEKVSVTNGTPTGSSVLTTQPPLAMPSGASVPGVVVVPPAPTPDLCLQHPEILACADISALHDLPAVVIPNTDIQFSALSSGSLSGTPICPPPILLPGLGRGPAMSINLSRDICAYASSIKFINLSLATMLSFWILSAGLRNG